MIIPGTTAHCSWSCTGAQLKFPTLFPSMPLLALPAAESSVFRHVCALMFTKWLLPLQLFILTVLSQWMSAQLKQHSFWSESHQLWMTWLWPTLSLWNNHSCWGEGKRMHSIMGEGREVWIFLKVHGIPSGGEMIPPKPKIRAIYKNRRQLLDTKKANSPSGAMTYEVKL